MGLKNPDQILRLKDLTLGDAMFVATGVTDGPLLKGVKFLKDQYIKTHSMIIQSNNIRYIETSYQWDENI